MTSTAYFQLVFGLVAGTAALLAAISLTGLVVRGENHPAGLLYVPIFAWLASNLGLGLATVGRYRRGILRAHEAGDEEQAARLGEIRPHVTSGALTNIDLGELPETAGIRRINRCNGVLGYASLACILAAAILDRI